jgi:two-component system, chemotaxis family, protein-glutamate methylesterase/glutaminase
VAGRLRVLVADDSPSVCRLLRCYLDDTGECEVVAQTYTGQQTFEAVQALRPDVVTLDCDLPDMSGLDTLDLIMRHCPTPVVMLSGLSRTTAEITLEALQLGAVDVIWKYTPGVNTDFEVLQQEILTKIRIASRVKVIRTLQVARSQNARCPAAVQCRHSKAPVHERCLAAQVVVIGASTGGPVVLKTILEALPPDFRAAMIVVQHMPALSTRALSAQLNRYAALEVREAREGDYLYEGLVLVAPGDHHLVLDTGCRVRLHNGPKIAGYRPNISLTMRSAVHVFGLNTSAVLLTGMGSDGVEGLQAVRGQGGATYVQDPASCVVDGMPASAIEQGLADHVAVPAALANLLQCVYCSH